MWNFLEKLFSSDFMGHGYCYYWRPEIVWLHAGSDSTIALAYYLIPVLLIYFVRKRRDLPFHWIFVMFGVFIFGCGTTHLMEVWTLWHGTYRLSGVIKAITAGASVATAVALIPMIPKALALPSPESLRVEIADRKRAEQDLHQAKSELERRVQDRTADLTRVNETLVAEIERRKRVEEALRASEERFRRYFELGLIGMAITMPNKGILEANEELCRILGYEQSELLGKSWADMTHPDDLAADVAQFNRVMAGEFDGYTLDKRWIRKDGRIIDTIMSSKCVRHADGSVDYFVGLIQDITERKRVEEEQRTLAALVENSPDFIGVASCEGQASIVNPTGRALVGLDSVTQVAQTRVLDYVVEEDREAFQQQIMPIVVKDGQWEGETRFRHFKTGAAIPMWQRIFLIRERGTHLPVAMATIANDISERKSSEQALLAAQAQLAHASRLLTLGELTSSIAHEVNQPLAAIVTNGDACLRWLAAPQPNLGRAQDSLNEMIREGKRASEIIKHIRTLAKKAAPRKEMLALNDVIPEVTALVNAELSKSGVHLRTEIAAEAPLVLADRVQVQQVILNLLMNGIEAMSDVSGHSKELCITSKQSEESGVLVSVSDTGKGMTPDSARHLFQAFFTTKQRGLGLGLSISRTIVEAHGGRIWATANPVHGATFHFTLPRVARATA